jgi:hypothetical protein
VSRSFARVAVAAAVTGATIFCSAQVFASPAPPEALSTLESVGTGERPLQLPTASCPLDVELKRNIDQTWLLVVKAGQFHRDITITNVEHNRLLDGRHIFPGQEMAFAVPSVAPFGPGTYHLRVFETRPYDTTDCMFVEKFVDVPDAPAVTVPPAPTVEGFHSQIGTLALNCGNLRSIGEVEATSGGSLMLFAMTFDGLDYPVLVAQGAGQFAERWLNDTRESVEWACAFETGRIFAGRVDFQRTVYTQSGVTGGYIIGYSGLGGIRVTA